MSFESSSAVVAPQASPFHPSSHHDAAPRGARGTVELAQELRHAGYRALTVRHESIGALDAPVVLVQGGISADRHVASSDVDASAGWWEAQVGDGRAIDTRSYRVIAIDWLAADGTLDAPIDTQDQADAIAAALDALGVARVHAYVGASYGAMVGLAFAARYPHRLARLVAVSGAHRAHPQATALRVVQRRIAALGADASRADAVAGAALAAARALAMIGYRTPAELAERFAAPPTRAAGGFRFACEDWLDACASRYVARTHPAAFLRLSESIDLHRVDPARIATPTTLVAIDEDQLVPRADLEALAQGIGARARLHTLRSRYGHDAFLKETAAIAAVLRAALEARA